MAASRREETRTRDGLPFPHATCSCRASRLATLVPTNRPHHLGSSRSAPAGRPPATWALPVSPLPRPCPPSSAMAGPGEPVVSQPRQAVDTSAAAAAPPAHHDPTEAADTTSGSTGTAAPSAPPPQPSTAAPDACCDAGTQTEPPALPVWHRGRAALAARSATLATETGRGATPAPEAHAAAVAIQRHARGYLARRAVAARRAAAEAGAAEAAARRAQPCTRSGE